MSKRSLGHIKKLSEGKYLLRLSCGFDEFGKRVQPSKTVYCSSDREAERLLMDFYRERDRLNAAQNAKIPVTLADLYADWYDNHVAINLTPKTAEFYTLLWNNHLKSGGKLKIKNAAPKNIHKLLSDINGDRTRNAAYKMLKAMFNKAVKWGYIADNPCSHITAPRYKAGEKKTLTEADIKAVTEALPQEEPKYRAMFYFAAVCGLRRQEILGLKWSDIDFKNKMFTIKRAATSIKNQGTVSKDTKTASSHRTLYLTDELEAVLSLCKQEQNTQRIKCGDKWINEDWIFTQWNGKLMNLQTPSHWWSDFSNRLGIEGVTFHGLRHTAATFMIKNNVPISAVSGVLGHAQISTTLNTYTHVIEDTKKAAITTLSEIFKAHE